MSTLTGFPLIAKRPSELTTATTVDALSKLVMHLPGGTAEVGTIKTILNSSYSGLGPRPMRPVSYYGVTHSTSVDQTTAINAACTAALADGYDLYWEPGVYIRTGAITSSVSWYGADRNLVEHRNNATNAVGGRIVFNNNGATVKNISFTSPNTPITSVNDAQETDCVLSFTSLYGVVVENNLFKDSYGGCVLFRSIVNGKIWGNILENIYKDGLHITGLSYNCIRAFNLIKSGGDDGIATVGYAGGGGTLGQPKLIFDLYNTVLGMKFARGFSYVGCKDITNVGSYVDGLMPTGFATAAPNTNRYRMLAGIYVASELSFLSHGNEDIYIENMTVKNCGFTSDFNSAALSAIHIVGRSGQVSRNIEFVNLTVEDVGTRGIFVSGGTAAGIENITISGKVKRNNDPNGWFGTTLAGNATGIEIQNTKNIKIDLLLDTIGSYGCIITNTCTGKAYIKLRTRDINTSGSAGTDILNIGSSSALSDIEIEIDIEKQDTVASSSNPYYIDRILECVNPGKIRKLIVNDYASLHKQVLTGITAQTITVTASPFTYTNSQPYPINIRISGGTVTEVARGMTTGVASPQYSTITGKLQGYTYVQPGESLVVTYSSAPTMNYVPVSS